MAAVPPSFALALPLTLLFAVLLTGFLAPPGLTQFMLRHAKQGR